MDSRHRQRMVFLFWTLACQHFTLKSSVLQNFYLENYPIF
jgi:hypothetical protein